MQLNRIQRNKKISHVFSWVSIAFVLVGLVGVIVGILLGETTTGAKSTVGWIIVFCSLGAIILGIIGALITFRLSEKYLTMELDERERLVSEESFFLGEKTLITFREKDLLIHPEGEEKGKEVVLPYSDVTFYKIIQRTSPHDKGDLLILAQIPAKYLNQESKGDEKPALVSMEAKERLFRCISEHGATLVEACSAGKPPRSKKCATAKYKKTEKRKIIAPILAGATVIAGILVAIFAEQMMTLGTLLAVFGAFACSRSVLSLTRANGAFVVYVDGVYWKEENKYERMYVRWADITCFSRVVYEKQYFIKFTLAYGDYYYPDVNGLYDYLKTLFPDKVKKVSQNQGKKADKKK